MHKDNGYPYSAPCRPHRQLTSKAEIVAIAIAFRYTVLDSYLDPKSPEVCCRYCHRWYLSGFELITHIKQAHGCTPSTTRDSDWGFTCPHCPLVFLHTADLAVHQYGQWSPRGIEIWSEHQTRQNVVSIDNGILEARPTHLRQQQHFPKATYSDLSTIGSSCSCRDPIGKPGRAKHSHNHK